MSPTATTIDRGNHARSQDFYIMVQAGRSRIRFPMRSLDFSIDIILGLTQPLTEISTSNLTGVKGDRRARLTT
jgi:hypothetical protein